MWYVMLDVSRVVGVVLVSLLVSDRGPWIVDRRSSVVPVCLVLCTVLSGCPFCVLRLLPVTGTVDAVGSCVRPLEGAPRRGRRTGIEGAQGGRADGNERTGRGDAGPWTRGRGAAGTTNRENEPTQHSMRAYLIHTQFVSSTLSFSPFPFPCVDRLRLPVFDVLRLYIEFERESKREDTRSN